MSSRDTSSSRGLNPNLNIPQIQFNSGSNTPASSTTRIHSNLSTRLNSPFRHQLLQDQMLTNKPAYKQIKINLKETPLTTPNVTKTVSFDTISKDYLDISDDDYEFDDSYDTNDDDDDIDYEKYEKQNNEDYVKKFNNKKRNASNDRKSRHNPNLSNYLSPHSQNNSSRGNSRTRGRSTSPCREASPPKERNFTSLNSIEGGISKEIYNKNGWRTDYPSRPSVDFDSFTLSFKNPQFDEYIREKENYRTIIIYITGRRHSWVALDFAIDKCLKNGDHLVVVSRIPSSYYGNDIRNKNLNHKNKHINDISFKKSAENIKDYLGFLIDDDKIAKYTIDLFQHDSTYTVLNEVIKIYEPSTLITSTKPNLKFKRNQTWKTARITDRLVKNFSLPIVVVPAFTMNEYEVEFFNKKISAKQLNSNVNQLQDKLKDFDLASSTIPSIPSSRDFFDKGDDESHADDVSHDDDDDNDDDDSSSIRSDDSEISENSGDSDLESNSSSFRDLTRTISNYQDILENFIEENANKEVQKDFFLNKLNKITDINHKISLKFTETSNSGGEGAALVRSLTGLPEVEKTKSMLDVLNEPSSTNDEAKVKNLKKSLYQNLSNGGGDSNSFTSSTPGTSTPNKTIKFSNDISNPKDLKLKSLEHLNSLNNNNDKNNGNALRKYNTHTEEPNHGSKYFGGKDLSPSRSQPQSLLTKSMSESKVQTLNSSNNNEDYGVKKKKSGFLSKMFGRSKDKKSKSRRPST